MRSKIYRVWKASSALLAAAIAFTATPAQAILYCTAQVNYVTVTPQGRLVVQLVGVGTPVMCDLQTPLSTTQGNIGITTCQAWVAGFLTAKATGKNVTLGFNFGGSPEPACNAVPNINWDVPTPFPYWVEFDK